MTASDPAGVRLCNAHQLTRRGPRRAVREVHAEYSSAGLDQTAHELGRVRRRSERADELGARGHAGSSAAQRTWWELAARGAATNSINAPGAGREAPCRPSPRSTGSRREGRPAPTGSPHPRSPPIARWPLRARARGASSQPRGRPCRELQVRERIRVVRVAPELGHEHVGPPLPDERRDDLAERLEPSLVARPGRERHVHLRALCGAGTALRHEPRSGEEVLARLVDRDGEDPGIVVEDRLRTVAVMHVDVDVGDPFGTVLEHPGDRR